MKLLLPSPSTSSSSSTAATTTTTTTTAFNANMCTSRSATASCLAGIFRRILCSRSLPTHPSDQITETSSMVCDHKHQLYFTNTSSDKLDAMATTTVAATAAAAPGVVARLMGLDSLPDSSSVDVGLTANSMSRSRWMNCVELRSESDQMGKKHRRIKSTLSVHEMPSFIELENEEFFVLSFEYGGESKESRSKERKCEVGFKELKEKRRHKAKRKEKAPNLEKKEEGIINKMVLRASNEAKLSDRISEGVGHGGEIEGFSVKDSTDKANVELQGAKRSSWAKHKEISDGAKARKKKRNSCEVKDIEEPGECSSQESSPVSVLDFDQFVIVPEIPTSEEDGKAGETNSRRRLRPELANHIHLSQHSDTNSIIDDRTMKEHEELCCGSRQKFCHNNQDYIKLWSQICRLVETPAVESNWVNKKIWKFSDFDDISEDFGLGILDQLLEELVDQLACLDMKYFIQ